MPTMSRSSRLILAASTSSGLALALLSSSGVEAQYRDLCTSVPTQCAYMGPDAPLLQANVCFGSTIGVRLMGSGSCPSGSWPYYVHHGEVVDPITNQVAPYIALDDACERPGICVEGPPPAGSQEFPMCCATNSQGAETCYDGGSCGGSIWWCYDGVCNEDGTITCFKKEPS
jgi:hypothetical protein